MRATAFHVPLYLLSDAVPEEHDSVQFFRLKNGSLVKRVHVWGNVVNKIVGEEYVRLTLDDMTGTVSVIFFDPLLDDARSVEIGDRVDVIGRLRQRNDDVGIVGEVLKIVGPKVELLRRLENVMFVVGAPRSEEFVPSPAARAEPKLGEGSAVQQPDEEEMEIETLDLEGDEW